MDKIEKVEQTVKDVPEKVEQAVKDMPEKVAAAKKELPRKAKKALFPKGIVWPARKECWKKTGVVIVTCVAFGVILIGADTVLGAALHLLIG